MRFQINRTIISKKVLVLTSLFFLFGIVGCQENTKGSSAFAKAGKEDTTSSVKSQAQRVLSKEWKEYWYEGKAEITSYKLSQSRYGELRDGTAALIFVTEDFLPVEQVKADRQTNTNIPILKLNTTKNFVTGIYPYAIMNSTFYPVKDKMHALKISQSIQEWCGHVYMQLNNKEQFQVTSHSYFDGEGDQEITLPLAILENELWTQLRINPADLPTGSLEVIPSFEFIRMRHANLKTYKAIATLKENQYILKYPNLNRTLTINFNPEFPYDIESWKETYQDTRGGKVMTTTAKKIITIKSDYWNKNKVTDEYLREHLEL